MEQVLHLPPETVYRIKSSQVITSVYAALKELVENALDSGASVLNVRLEGYGLNLIEVKDNGHGISEADLSKVCLPHTTSKILQFSDLERLSTYGFRGEALSALCQLASVTITSKPRSCSVGRSCCFSATGQIASSKCTACNVGTCVTVTKLFHSLPVRLKYHSDTRRKKEQLKKMEDLLMAYSVARPALHVTLTHDRQVVYHKSAAADTLQCLHAVFKDCAPSLVNVCSTRDQLSISVFLPRPSKADLQSISSGREASLRNKKKALALPPYCRSAPDRLFILINDRPVFYKELEKRVKLFFSACHECFEGRWPAGVVTVRLPPHTVDVNLEPSKDRVVISSEDLLLELLTEILTELYGPVSEAVPKPLLGKQAAEENQLHDDVNKENINSSSGSSNSECTDVVYAGSASNVGNNLTVQSSFGSTSISISRSKNNAIETGGSESSSNDLLEVSDLTAAEQNVLEEILSQDTVSQDPIASKLTSALALPVEKPHAGHSPSPARLKEHRERSQSQDNGNISSEKNEVTESTVSGTVGEVPTIINSNHEVNDNNAKPPSTLLRGVSGSIHPLAWSKGQIVGNNGANIQSVHVLSGDHRGYRRGLSEDCSGSPAKRLKTSLDEFNTPLRDNSSSFTGCKPSNTSSDPPALPVNEDFITDSDSEVRVASGVTVEDFMSGTLSANSSNHSHSPPAVQITSPDSIPTAVTRNSNSAVNFGVTSDSVLIRTGVSSDSVRASGNSPGLGIAVSSSKRPSPTIDMPSSPLSESGTPLHLQSFPRRPETSADRAACRTVLGTPTTERLPHGGHLISKPITAFAAYAKHIRSDVLRELAGADFTVVGKEIAARWRALGAERRCEYEQMAQRDVVRYNNEIKELRQRHCVAGVTGSPVGAMDRFVSPVNRKSFEDGGHSASDSKSSKGGSTTRSLNSTPGSAAGVKKNNKAGLKPWQNRCVTADVSVSHIKSLLVARSKKSSAPAAFRLVGKLQYPSLTSSEGGGACAADARDSNAEASGGQPTCPRINAHSPDTILKPNTLRDQSSVSATGNQTSPRNSSSSGPDSNGGRTTANTTVCWVCVDPQAQAVYGVRSGALCELLLCCRLLESYELPAQLLAHPIPFNESTLLNWDALLRLPRRPDAERDRDVVTDRRLTSNGLEVVLYRDGPAVTHGELVALADNVGFYGINDLQEVLAYIARNPAATLMQTRPVKLRHWIQAESVRILRSSSEADDHEGFSEKLRRWHYFSRKYARDSPGAPSLHNVPSFITSSMRGVETSDVPQSSGDVPLLVPGLPNLELCLHNKPVLHLLYDLDELPGSQSQRSQCSQ